jgi:hypothetical protein
VQGRTAIFDNETEANSLFENVTLAPSIVEVYRYFCLGTLFGARVIHKPANEARALHFILFYQIS